MLCWQVHEGPQGISPRIASAEFGLVPGMIVSNEVRPTMCLQFVTFVWCSQPGYYKNGDYGIRIENLQVVVPDPQNAGFLGFKTLTMVPLQAKLVDFALLTCNEKLWLEQYHLKVLETVGARIGVEENDRAVLKWLECACAPFIASSSF